MSSFTSFAASSRLDRRVGRVRRHVAELVRVRAAVVELLLAGLLVDDVGVAVGAHALVGPVPRVRRDRRPRTAAPGPRSRASAFGRLPRVARSSAAARRRPSCARPSRRAASQRASARSRCSRPARARSGRPARPGRAGSAAPAATPRRAGTCRRGSGAGPAASRCRRRTRSACSSAGSVLRRMLTSCFDVVVDGQQRAGPALVVELQLVDLRRRSATGASLRHVGRLVGEVRLVEARRPAAACSSCSASRVARGRPRVAPGAAHQGRRRRPRGAARPGAHQMKNGFFELALAANEILGDLARSRPASSPAGSALPSRCRARGPKTVVQLGEDPGEAGRVGDHLDLRELDELAREVGVAPGLAACRPGSSRSCSSRRPRHRAGRARCRSPPAPRRGRRSRRSR